MQRLTARRMLRPYPIGLRFSGSNMSPLPGWLAGAHSIALNFSHCDLQAQLHFALFHGSGGYVLKPKEMREASTSGVVNAANDSAERVPPQEEDSYWPPPRSRLHRTTIEILSLHNLPKRSERRPRFDGHHGACHKYHPELSGAYAPPDNSEPSSPAVSVALHPIGGFCAVSRTLPLPQSVETQTEPTPAVEGNGMNASFGQVIHCVAAEPHETFLRVSVTDSSGQEVAYETAVLGRLRHGYRVLQLRGTLGTRIELCYLFVKISFGSEPNLWATPRHMRMQSNITEKRSTNWHEEIDHHVSERVRPHLDEITKLKMYNTELEHKLGELLSAKQHGNGAESPHGQSDSLIGSLSSWLTHDHPVAGPTLARVAFAADSTAAARVHEASRAVTESELPRSSGAVEE